MKKPPSEITIRSSAAEYLTFIAATGDNPQSIEIRYEDENIWLTQKILAVLYDVEVATINEHLKKIYNDLELMEEATIRKFLIVQTEGSRQVEREVKHYALQTIIAVGFKVNSERAVQFRKWVNQIARDYTIKGWVMDKDELFELERIVSAYLDLAETMAKRGIPMTMYDWNRYLSEILKLNRYEILNGKGRISAEQAKQHAETEFEKYRVIQDRLFESDFDRFLQLEDSVNLIKPPNT